MNNVLRMKHPNFIVILCFLNLLDLITTMLCFKYAAIGGEGNPIMAWVIDNYGFFGTFVIKVIALSAIIYLDIKGKAGTKLRWYLILFYTFIVINNFLVLIFFPR